jgi:hypothetical protein
MDPLEIAYDSMDAVPEAFRPLYAEKDGKAVLSNINGIKTEQDVLNVQEALRKERENHNAAREALKPWKGLGDDPAKIQEQLDRIAELEAAAGGKLDDDAINKIVEGRLTSKTAPLQRQLDTVTEELNTVRTERDQLAQSIETRDMNDAVRAVATEMKVLGTAIPDVEMVAANYLQRDGTTGEFVVKSDAKGVTPGGDLKMFMKEMQKLRPHWWPASEGGGGAGAGPGGGAANPWTKEGWSLTAQGQYIREHGMAAAEQAAKAAKSRIGATSPTT